MTIRKKANNSKVIIDLDGPDGNAFFLLGSARKFAKQLGKTEKEINAIIEDMKSGDYENLIKVFDREFGEFVILERSE